MKKICLAFVSKLFLLPIAILFILLINNSLLMAQNPDCSDNTLKKALEMYQTGKFKEVFLQLDPCLESSSRDYKIQAYRLRSLTNIALGRYADAELDIREILLLQPSFSSTVLDPAPFQELVIKARESARRLDFMHQTVVSASKRAQDLREAPKPISVVTAEQIKNFGWQSMNEVLYRSTGFFPSRDFERNTLGARGSWEGWNNNHLLVLIDGIPVNDNLNGSAYTWEITPLVFTNSFEIIRGPGSGLYGSNAVNGVLTLNTSSSSNFIDNYGFVKSEIGNRSSRSLDIVTGFNTTLFSVVTSFSQFSTDGDEYETYDNSREKDENGNLKTFTTNDSRSGMYLFTKLTGRQKLDGLTLQYHRQTWQFETGHGWIFQIPEKKENMIDSRDILMLKYKREPSRKFSYEYVLRYQRHKMDWNLNFARPGSFDGYYPNGVNEYLLTKAHDLFTRIEYSFVLMKKASIIYGIESSTFYYSGDDAHYSNVDLVTGIPFENNETKELGSFLEYIEDKPVVNVGGFFSISSDSLLGKKFKLSGGFRYDIEFFKYTDITLAERPLVSKSFKRLSPRFAAIYLPNNNVALKFMVGTAFRAPMPTEMFGANTWTVSSNIKQLEPEYIWSVEFSGDFKVHKNLHLRSNVFITEFHNQIGYSQSANTSNNLFTLTNTGLELEILYGYENFSTYFNLTGFHRLDEKINSSESAFISTHTNRITWSPALVSNIGFNYALKRWNMSLFSHYQGAVKRRDLDILSEAELIALGLSQSPRADKLPAWISVDAKVNYRVKNMEFYTKGTNIFNGNNYLVKSLKYPFDYKSQGRRIYVGIIINFKKSEENISVN